MSQLSDHAIKRNRQLANLVPRDDVNGSVEASCLDLSCAFQQAPDWTGDATADQHCKHQSYCCGKRGHDGRDHDHSLLISNNDGGARVDLAAHIGADHVDLLVELVAESINSCNPPSDLRKILRVELGKQRSVLVVHAMAEVIDRVIDPGLDARQRGIIRRRADIVDDLDDQLLRGFRFLLDLGTFLVENLQIFGIAGFVWRILQFGDDHPAQSDRSLEGSDIRPRQMTVCREVFGRLLVEQVTYPSFHQHRKS